MSASRSAYVIDASVFVADARPSEPFHATVNALLRRFTVDQSVIYTPTIVLPEVAAAIARGTNDPQSALRLVILLRRLPHVHFIPVDAPLSDQASIFAADYRIRGCDAIYVALAHIQHATLITLDSQQRERAPRQVTARTPAEELNELAKS